MDRTEAGTHCDKVFYAHSDFTERKDGQAVLDHLKNVAELAKGFSMESCSTNAYFCGMIHDIGKYSEDFQQRLKGSRKQVDHATAGANEAWKLKALGAAFCIAGHHGGLPDFGSRIDSQSGTLYARMSCENISSLPNYSAFRNEVAIPLYNKESSLSLEDFYFYTQYLYSCLVDADWTDTEQWYSGSKTNEPDYASLEECEGKLNAYLNSFQSERPLNACRTRIRNHAAERAEASPGFFTMTVPTGGGKTLASIAFALRHAICHGKKRILYVIPYCSILEQTGEIFYDIFGENNVALRYSTAESEISEEDGRFLSEAWDEPIVLTTAVQFFESIFAAKPSSSRKIHNFAESVIVFDEAQMLPVPYLRPCVCAICQLVKNFGSSAILCTATQPSLDRLLFEYAPQYRTVELCPPLSTEEKTLFRRVCYRNEGKIEEEALITRLQVEHQVLCIVNNRKQAQSIFNSLCGDNLFCLTTYLTPHDRKEKLDAIRKCLASGEECKVVSTSLIEAGVDLDFPCVYRAIAGLDSIIQAAGRCNREGKKKNIESVVHIFETEGNLPFGLGINIGATRITLREHPDDISSPEAIRCYFDELYHELLPEQNADKKEIMQSIKELAFRTIGEKFKLIEDAKMTLYIRTDENERMIQAYEEGKRSRMILRKMNDYAVSITEQEIKALLAAGQIKEIDKGLFVLTDASVYDIDLGLSVKCESKAIIM
ncbi:MAG: CRISPR-associated helicase Cas3' [Eubacteriales bacterium]